MNKERFSLLLLEPNEIYFEDFSVNLIQLTEDAVTDILSDKGGLFSGGRITKNDDDDDDDDVTESVNKNVGRLKMCSKSIVYDPKDCTEPIIKIPYKDCDEIFQWPEYFKQTKNALAIKCSQYTKMLDKNILAPYQFVMGKRTFIFNLHYGKVDQYLNQLCQLHRASSLHAFEQNDMIATIVFSRHNRLKFDPLWLEDIYEPIILDNTIEEINPLIMNPGRLILTTKCIYFQPYNNILPYPVKKIQLKTITNLTKRRFLLRHVSLEIKWTDVEMMSTNCSSTTRMNDYKEHILYVSFRNQKERDIFYDRTIEQELVKLTNTQPESMTLKWQNGVISNYDYLLYLNSLADRTFQDLTQYPIFPWVICDYTSTELDLTNPNSYRDLTKPIGALNPERLMRLKERCEEMGEPKFLYGSHYSAPGLVLFYLVRKYPKLMLCLQNGKFDHPDRMFNRVEDAFNNCLNNMSDFKELIPEFYDITGKGDFLINEHKINFGTKYNGQPVNHVTLPPWSNGSPEIFISKLREALESEYVSLNLHNWIDLIFGYKQRGAEAVKADNLFYYLCYEGSVDLDKVKELTSRHALEVQISEFGQIPKQLFDKPHVPKNVTKFPMKLNRRKSNIDGGGEEKEINDHEQRSTSQSSSTPPFGGGSSDNNKNNEIKQQICDKKIINNLILYEDIKSHKDVITCVTVNGNNNNNNNDDKKIKNNNNQMVISTGKDGLLKCYNILEKRQTRSVSLGSVPLSYCLKLPDSNTIVLGSWDNSIITYNLDYGRVSNVIPAHDDCVSCLAILSDLGIVVSGSWDCSVKIWKGFNSTTNTSFRMSDALLAYLSLDEKVASVTMIRNKNLIHVVIGTFIGEVILWTLELSSLITDDSVVIQFNGSLQTISQKIINKHSDEITAVSFNPSGTKIVSCSLDGELHVCDLATGMTLFRKQNDQALTCLNWTMSDAILFLGNEIGQLYVWNMITGSIELQLNVFNGLISTITSTNKQYNINNHDDDDDDDQNDGNDDDDDDDEKHFVIVAGIDGQDFPIKIFQCL